MRLTAAGIPFLLLAGCTVAPQTRNSPTESEFRTLMALGNGSNIAVTSDSDPDPRLRMRVLPGTPADVRAALLRAAVGLPRWSVMDSSGSILWLTRTTRLFRFVDDIFVLVEPREAGAAIQVRSASRVGNGDLGQNRRNIAELWAGLEADALLHPPVPAPTPVSSP